MQTLRSALQCFTRHRLGCRRLIKEVPADPASPATRQAGWARSCTSAHLLRRQQPFNRSEFAGDAIGMRRVPRRFVYAAESSFLRLMCLPSNSSLHMSTFCCVWFGSTKGAWITAAQCCAWRSGQQHYESERDRIEGRKAGRWSTRDASGQTFDGALARINRGRRP